MNVPPAFGVALAVVLVITKSDDGLTVKVALTKLGLAPTEVVKEPAGISLTNCGEVIEVTTTETEQLALGAICVPEATDIWLPPAAAVGTGPVQLVVGAGVVPLNSPAGYASTNAALKVAVVSLWVLVKVMTSKVVPPALMVLGLNVLATVGKLAVTVSLSAAVHVPATQPGAVLVLVTFNGGVIEAVLVIWVCAKASCGVANPADKPNTSVNALSA